MTIEELMDETVADYAADPVNRRSVHQPEHGYDDKECYYRKVEGSITKTCAVGRCMDMRSYRRELEGKKYHPDRMTLKNKYKPFAHVYRRCPTGNLYLFVELQRLHDRDIYWTATGLSAVGTEFVKTLKGMEWFGEYGAPVAIDQNLQKVGY